VVPAGGAEVRKDFFFEKRSKKLLLLLPAAELPWVTTVLPETGKGFLVLFFKKEHLPILH
jgi:hypothetical protein